MRITPVNYNYANQKNSNKPTFGASISPENLSEFAINLKPLLNFGDTAIFLDEFQKHLPDFKNIKFNNAEDVTINIDKLEGKKNIFRTTSNLLTGSGSGQSEFKIKKLGLTSNSDSGKEVFDKVFEAIKDATEQIAESSDYLIYKANEIANS